MAVKACKWPGRSHLEGAPKIIDDKLEDMDTPTATTVITLSASRRCTLDRWVSGHCGKVAPVSKANIQARDALPQGERLKDYDIEGLLGVGGFGLVYRAREDALQRQVAIKEYLPSSLALRGEDGRVVLRSPDFEEPFALGMRSFINEARLLARFDHPSLVRVIRFWEDRGTAYMVMPCYEGPTLYEARRALAGPPTEEWLRALMDALLGALECLHREQVFHRDVAPDNILLVDDQDAPCGIRPVLLDFGAARRVISDHTQALTAILKPSFAPIEQYAETTVLRQGPWTDLYGLAAVLHYCITGRTPVPATARAVHDDLPSLSQMAPALAQDFGRHYSPALLATIDKALSVKPDDRPASVAAWRECLLAAPASAVVAADGQASSAEGDPASVNTSTERSVWNERTVLANGAAQVEAPSSFAATLPVHEVGAGGAVHRAGTGSRQSWPQSVVWGLGVVALTGLVVLSAWSVKRHQQEGKTGADTVAAVVQAPTPTGAVPTKVAESAAQRPLSASAANGSADLTDRSRADAAAQRKREAREAREARSQARKAKAASDAADQAVTAAKAPLSPRQACGGRIFIALAICMKRYCGMSQYARHPECARMRAQERSQQDSMRPYP
jgi:serine/threonine protein kinase